MMQAQDAQKGRSLTLPRRLIGWFVLAVVITATVAVGKWQARAERAGDRGPADVVREAAWDGLVDAPEVLETYELPPIVIDCSGEQPTLTQGGKTMALTWGGYAKTQVPGNALSGSCTFKHAIWPNMNWQDESYASGFTIYLCGLGFEILVLKDGVNHPGEVGFEVKATFKSEPPVFWYLWVTPPTTGVDYVEIPLHVAVENSTSISSRVGSNPIGGKKSNATHAKERLFEDRWESPDGQVVYTIDGDSYSGTVPDGANMTSSLLAGIDANDWQMQASTIGLKYILSFEDISFNGNPINTTAYTPRTWHPNEKLWVEGFGGSSIGLWASDTFSTAPYYTYTYDGGTINAPYSYDFSNMAVKWMDGSSADAVTVSCTGLRQIINGHVFDVPWQGTMAELKALGRYTQKHGCYFWDTEMADMLAAVTVYMDYASMRSMGMLDHGKAEIKVEGCMYGVEDVEGTLTTSPVDGDYYSLGLHNGFKLYTNGLYYIWALDAEGNDWGIGPDQYVPPYYITIDGGGVENIYYVNEDVYEDSIIDEETGWKRFTGLTGFGPVVSAQPNPTDPDTSTPSFAHDATLIIDAWPLSATSRTGSPYMQDVAMLLHSDWVDNGTEEVPKWEPSGDGLGIYKDAVDNTDWVGDGCTTPSAGGNFSVTAAGGTLELDLPSNYIQRQADVGTVGAITIPPAYLTRKADAFYGDTYEGTPIPSEVNHEAIYDWRGWSYLKNAVQLPAGVDSTTVTVTFEYYMDLDGISDNHLTDSTRVSEYSYDPGELHTYSVDVPISVFDENRKATFIVDLYWVDPVLALVTTIKYAFADAGAYVLYEPELISDQGDPQTGREAYVDPDTGERGNDGGLHKYFESPRYAQGGFSAVYNGIFQRQLFAPDNAKANQIEYCFPQLNVLIGAKTGEDLTSNYSLAALPITNSCDAWLWVHNAGNEAAHMTDSDGATLKTLNCYDIVPNMAGTNVDLAVRCYELTCVPGLPYNFYGTHWVGGAGHGMTKTSSGERKRAFPPDYLDVADLCYRDMGSEDEDDYVATEPIVKADIHGHWHDGDGDEHPTGPPTDLAQDLLEWAVKGREYVSLGQLWTREYCAADVVWVGNKSNPRLWCEDVTGITHLVFVNGDDVHYTQSDPWTQAGGFRGWRYGGLNPVKGTAQTIAVFEGGYTAPSVVVLSTREIVVSARSTTSPYTIALKRSRDQGATWEAITLGSFTADLTQLALWTHRGMLHGVGITGGNAVYRRSDDGGTTAAPLDGAIPAATSKTVATAEDEQPSLVRDTTGALYAALNTGSAIAIMTSSDGGNTWAATDTV